MTLTEALDILLARCEFRQADTQLRTLAEAEMRLAQQALEGAPELPWFLLVEDAMTRLTPLEERLAVPEGFIMLDDDREVELFTTSAYEDPSGLSSLTMPDEDVTYYGTWQGLKHRELSDIKARYGDLAGAPKTYFLGNAYFYFRPIPDQAYPIRMTYYAHDGLLYPDGVATNKWLTYAPNVLIAETGLVIAGQYLHNDTLMQKFDGMAKNAWQQLWARNNARRMGQREVIMGDEE